MGILFEDGRLELGNRVVVDWVAQMRCARASAGRGGFVEGILHWIYLFYATHSKWETGLTLNLHFALVAKSCLTSFTTL